MFAAWGSVGKDLEHVECAIGMTSGRGRNARKFNGLHVLIHLRMHRHLLMTLSTRTKRSASAAAATATVSPVAPSASAARVSAVRRSPRFLTRAESSVSTATPPAATSAPPAKRTKKKTATASSKPTATSSGAEDGTATVSFRHGTLSRKYEQAKMASGKYQYVVGCDEAGRGPLAGPVVAAACYVPLDVTIEGIHDSKKLTEPQREALFEQLTSHPQIQYAVSIKSAQRIDEINILQASLEAMSDAVAALSVPADFVFVDGNRMPPQLSVDAETVVQGDSKVYAIAAASVLAKVTRDRIMVELHEAYPQYNLKQHKGYPTREHMAAIAKHGACEIHRMTFAPLKPKPTKPKKA